jgi:hypothetical protein
MNEKKDASSTAKIGSLPEVGAEICHNVGMATVLHHEDLLLNDAEVRCRQLT